MGLTKFGRRALYFAAVGAALCCGTMATINHRVAQAQAPAENALKPASDFSHLTDVAERSKALFMEASKVITHPRCMNCHPATQHPTQGEDMHVHRPLITRGEDGFGPAALRCTACHGEKNYDTARVPGNIKWHLAPAEMAWQGKTIGQICEQIKDPKRNNNMGIGELVQHMAKDELVGWAWNPGAGRTPAPGTQQSFGDLISAWADAGAVCPQ